MGVQYDDARRGYVVRWREGGRRQRNRRFATEAGALEFDASLRRIPQMQKRDTARSRAGGRLVLVEAVAQRAADDRSCR